MKTYDKVVVDDPDPTIGSRGLLPLDLEGSLCAIHLGRSFEP